MSLQFDRAVTPAEKLEAQLAFAVNARIRAEQMKLVSQQIRARAADARTFAEEALARVTGLQPRNDDD